MKRTNHRLRLCAALLLINLVFIWGNSLLPRELSAAFSRMVGDWIRRLFQLQADISEGTGHGRLRKLAHFAEFLSMGALLHWHCRLRWQKPVSTWLLPAGLGVAVACIDETLIYKQSSGLSLLVGESAGCFFISLLMFSS